MGLVLSVLTMIFFAAGGLSAAMVFFKNEKPAVILMLGLAIGLAEAMWLPAVFAFVFGFGLLAQGLAIVAAGVIMGLCAYFSRGFPFDFKGIGKEKHMLAVVVPVAIFTVYLLGTHIIPSNAAGGLDTGQSCFGDMPMHLAFITSLSVQKVFPPVYSLVGGNIPVGYPFLCDSVSSTFYTMGASLGLAYVLPMFFAILAVYMAIYLLFEKMLGSPSKAVLATVLFLIGGGFGFAYFLDGLRTNPGNLMGIFQNFYTTPTNYADKNVLWVNPIADMILPQRATLFGWSILFPCLYLLYSAVFNGKKQYFVPLGIMAGLMPLVHTHSYMALVILSGVYFVMDLWDQKKISWAGVKSWLAYILIAGGLSLPQLLLFTFKQAGGEGFLRLGLNWVNQDDNYLWFYVKNIGLLYILIIPAFLQADRNIRRFYGGGLAVLYLAETVIFQPNPYDNNKLLFVWYLLSCGLVAGFLGNAYQSLRSIGFKGLSYFAVLVMVAMNASGLLTLGREAVSNYQLFSSQQVAAAEFIKRNTGPKDRFLTADNHNNAVASLTGRNILCGSGSYLYYHGLPYQPYEAAEKELFIRPSWEGLREYGIDYVYIGNYEKEKFSDMDISFFDENLEVAYDNGSVRIYRVKP